MVDLAQKLKTLTSKDEEQSLKIIRQMLDDNDVELFKALVEKSDFLFPFVRENIAKRIEKSITPVNFLNLYNFLDYYSPDYETVFISAFRIFGKLEAKNKFYDLLKTGSVNQKIYAVKYFAYIKDSSITDFLIKHAFSEEEYLADACAFALGVLEDKKSYNFALTKLNSDDDFEKLSGLNFFVSYVKNPPMQDIFAALQKTGMPENFAGKIAYLSPVITLLQEDLINGLTVLDYILTGFGEILPLSEVFNYDLYNAVGLLSEMPENEYSSKIAVVLLRAKSKFDTICSNDEYTFDETQDTKAELNDIHNLLSSFDKNFWQKQTDLAVKELNEDKASVLSALEIIKELNITSALPMLLELLYEHEDETVLCEALSCLKQFGNISDMPKENVLPRINDSNLKAIAESYYA